MKFPVIFVGLFILVCETMSQNGNDEIGCYSMNNENSKFEFYCKKTESNFNTACKPLKASEVTKQLNLSAVTNLRMCKCDLNLLVTVAKELKNMSDLDISYSEYNSNELFDKSHLDVLFNRNLVNLSLEHNNLTDIPDNVFNTSLTNVRVVKLSHNKIAKIKTDTFNGAVQMTNISLVQNELIDIEWGAFANLTNLLSLDISKNRLTRLNRILGNNSKMARLQLRDNPILRIDCNIFSPLERLPTINVSLNNATQMDITCIDDLQLRLDNIDSITKNEKIVELHCNEQSFQYLKLITAKNNQTKNVEAMMSVMGPSIKNISTLNLLPSDLTEFDFSSLTSSMTNFTILNLTDNNLKRIKNVDKITPIGFVEFNAKGNQIQNITDIVPHLNLTIEDINFSGNAIGKINASTFKRLNRLKRLSLSDTKLQFEDSNPFEHLSNLTYIDISHNNLSDVNFANLSTTLNKLQGFSVAYGHIQNVTDITKYFGSSITVLDFSGNLIGHLDAKIFLECKTLTGLFLSRTHLSISGSNPFQNLQLKHLDISHNNEENIDWSILSTTLTNLQTFKVAGCQIKNVLKVVELLGPSISDLDISEQESSEQMTKSTFEKFTKLEKLYLNQMKLKTFDLSIVEPNKRLKLLNISHNQLTTLNISLKMEELETLDLRGNDLKELHNFDKYHLPNLIGLGISQNLIDCGFLDKIDREWDYLEFIDVACSQKHENCRPDPKTPPPENPQILYIVTGGLGTFLICVLIWIFRKRFLPKNKNENTDNENLWNEGNYQANNKYDEHTYEEIGLNNAENNAAKEPNGYQSLDFRAPPSTAILEHYDNFQPKDEPAATDNDNDTDNDSDNDKAEPENRVGIAAAEPYSHLNYDPKPSNCRGEHYDKPWQQNEIQMQMLPAAPYDKLNYDPKSSSTLQPHYDNAHRQECEAAQPADPPYNHLDFNPPPSSAIQPHYSNATQPSNDPEVIPVEEVIEYATINKSTKP